MAKYENFGRKVLAVNAEKASSVTCLFNECNDRLSRVSLLVNNAGIVGGSASVTNFKDEGIAHAFEVNASQAGKISTSIPKANSVNGTALPINQEP